MRVLMVTDSYPPLIGGATRDTQLLSRELVKRGYAVDVATVAQPGLATEEGDAGVRVHRIEGLLARFSADPHRRHHPPIPDPSTVWQFRRLIRDVRPDIAHAYGWIAYSCVAALLPTKIPLLISIRDYSTICAIRTLVQQRPDGERICSGPALGKCLACASRYYDGAARTVASVGGVFSGQALLRQRVQGFHYCSAYMQGVTRRHLLAGHTFSRPLVERVIPGFGDDAGDGAPDEGVLAQLPVEPYILFVGALRPIKGLAPLLEAYGRLESPPPLVLLGPRTPETPASFPAGITVVPGASHATVMAAWERALFGVAPSLLPEPFGNVVHEGMSRGRAMIGTAPSGMSDMIADGETGLLVAPGDAVALERAMRRLVGDAGLRERLGAAARERARLFTAAAVMPHFEDLYRQLVDAPIESPR